VHFCVLQVQELHDAALSIEQESMDQEAFPLVQVETSRVKSMLAAQGQSAPRPHFHACTALDCLLDGSWVVTVVCMAQLWSCVMRSCRASWWKSTSTTT
jgi:hypothetical protein